MSLSFEVGGLLVPLIALSLDEFGWRNTFFASGVISIVVGLPLAQVMRHKPEDYGEYVDGEPPQQGAPAASVPTATLNRPERDFTLTGGADAVD